jgi:acetylserotonin N-methyltransferase
MILDDVRHESAPSVSAAPVLDLIHAFRRSKTMFTAVSLGIFDGKRPAGAWVPELLDACVALGLLVKMDGRYVNTDVADTYLRRASPSSLAGYIRYSDAVLFRLWANLEHAIVDGTPRWEETFGGDAAAVRRSILGGEDFLLGMHGVGMLTSPCVVDAFDLSPYRFLVDLGGATGHLACAAKRRYPALKVAVFDLRSAIDLAARFVPPDVELIAGDFMTDPLPAADLFVLGRILHHRNERRIHSVLERVYAMLPPGGAVLVVEKMLDSDRSGPVEAHMHSLNMLVCTDEGRERTFDEYRTLLDRAGFRDIRARVTSQPRDVSIASN